MDLFVNEHVLDKYLNIQINIDDKKNNMLKYEIFGNNKPYCPKFNERFSIQIVYT